MSWAIPSWKSTYISNKDISRMFQSVAHYIFLDKFFLAYHFQNFIFILQYILIIPTSIKYIATKDVNYRAFSILFFITYLFVEYRFFLSNVSFSFWYHIFLYDDPIKSLRNYERTNSQLLSFYVKISKINVIKYALLNRVIALFLSSNLKILM